MAITTYATLSTAVQSFMLDRTDVVAATVLPDLVALAEHAIFHGLASDGKNMEPLRCLAMETVGTVTLTSGIGPLPSDFLQWRRVVQTTVPRRELEYITPAGADQQYPSRASGPGNHFTIIGANLYTFPLVATSAELTYYQQPTALDSSTPSTAHTFLTKYPSIYLRAVCAMAADWQKDDEEMQKQLALLKSLIGAVNNEMQMVGLAKTGVTFRRQVR